MSALNRLDGILREAYAADCQGKKRKRSERLVRPPDTNEKLSTYAYLPTAFNSALDIEQSSLVRQKRRVLIWTQGVAFAFQPGHTIYDTPAAYAPWEKALREIRFCISIKEAMPVEYSTSGPIQVRNPGKVKFAVLTPDASKTGLVNMGTFELTQDAFALLLIAGPRSSQLDASPYLSAALEILDRQLGAFGFE